MEKEDWPSIHTPGLGGGGGRYHIEIQKCPHIVYLIDNETTQNSVAIGLLQVNTQVDSD